ncbi:MAG TPA: bifunctional enoyl-CoA hydratase/phosphate acetyltransferase [bacterium]|nr:bifunctional enoyl-CoA hydratase/phosphate acetyltransferase [bacterium]
MLKSFAEIHDRVKGAARRRLAVAGAAHPHTLQAVSQAHGAGLVDALLFGPAGEIEAAARKAEVDLSPFEVRDVTGDAETAAAAVEAVRSGEAGMLMKGSVPTGVTLRAVLDKQKGLRSGELLSHIACLEVPGHDRLIWVTDGGLNIRPDQPTKAEILANAVNALHRLGYERPNVAVLAAVEEVNPDMPETLDAAALAQMGERGQFGACEVDGPLALDLAVNAEAARIKGVESPVAGKADILLVPDIHVGNIFAKGLIYLGGAKVGGMVAGATAPVVLLSRADTTETKLNSIALCTAAAG